MATNEVPRGPISGYAAENARRLRAERGWKLAQLSEAMRRVGRPMLSSGLSRLETGQRRMDVDDLVALALVYGVSPITFLLPWSEGEAVQLTHTTTAGAETAWGWMRAMVPLDLPAEQYDADVAELAFQRASLPPAGRGYVQRVGRHFAPLDESPGELVGGGGDGVEHREAT
jgi:transcriptional regulator with XRE-family HTH domain